MSIPDQLMAEWFQLLTDREPEEIRRLTNQDVAPGEAPAHPMQAKKTLGRDIVSFYHGEAATLSAQAEWGRRFSQRQDPTEIEEARIPGSELTDGRLWICKLLVLSGLAKSNNEARRHVEGGAVTVGPEREKITDAKATVTVADGLIVRVGSRKVVRVRLV
jgi:tyrosyl-tRNA synthetase